MSSGWLRVVGLGPGAADLVAPRAARVLEAATDLVGYGPYLDRVALQPGQEVHRFENREELARARCALGLTASGCRVAMVSGGDAGVFAMASAVFEAIEDGDPRWRALDIEIVPGISAMFAVAAQVGAPLGHDFCAISLSDNLKSWNTVIRRLLAAAEAGFVIALYNAASRARPWQLSAALDALRTVLPSETPVILATAVSRPDEAITITSLKTADPALADMRTLVLIGTAATRRIERSGSGPWVYTPRRSAA